MSEAPLIARIAFSTAPFASTPGWTDISNTVLRCSTRRGRNHELDRMEAGWAVIQLLNVSGDYWPYNTTGAYTPNVLPGKKINIRAKRETIGYETVGGTPVSAVDNIHAVKLTPVADSRIGSFFVFINIGLGAADEKLKGALFDSDLNLLGETAEITPIGQTWNELAFTSEMELTGGSDYWFAVWADVIGGDVFVFYDAGDVNQQATDALAYGAWPDPLVPDSQSNNQLSLYAESIYDIYTGFIENWQPSFLSPPDRIPIMTLQCADFVKNTSRLLLNNTTGYVVEASGTRVANVLSDLGWPTSALALDTGQSNFQTTGALANANAQDHLFKAQNSEPGIVYLTPDGNVAYEDRHHRLGSDHVTSAAVFGEDAGEMGYHRLHLAFDDWYIYNDVRMTIEGGTEQVATSTTSQDDYGKRSLSRTGLFNNTDTDAESQAAYLRTKYENPLMRASEIEIRPDHDPTNLYPKALGYDISTRITVRHNASSLDEDYYIEGINHDWMEGKPWQTRWQLSKAEAYEYWKLGIAGYSELGSTTRPFY